MRRKDTKAAKVGRPAAGLRDGEMVKDYPQLCVRVPPDVRKKLIALSKMQRQPQWRVMIQALDCYVRAQPLDARLRLEELVRR
jgi:hypothetical protein